jgi:hypothetical protein
MDREFYVLKQEFSTCSLLICYMHPVFIYYTIVSVCISVLQPFSSSAHPNLSKTYDSTAQNFASRKQERNYNMYLHTSPCPVRMQAHESITQPVLNKTSDDERACACVCLRVLRILITLICNFFLKYCFLMYDTSSWTVFNAVYRYIFRIFLSPSVKKKYVIQKNIIFIHIWIQYYIIIMMYLWKQKLATLYI